MIDVGTVLLLLANLSACLVLVWWEWRGTRADRDRAEHYRRIMAAIDAGRVPRMGSRAIVLCDCGSTLLAEGWSAKDGTVLHAPDLCSPLRETIP